MGNENLRATPILDYEHPTVQKCLISLESGIGGSDFLRAAHRLVATVVSPVYSLKEFQPVSVTLTKKRGSCSQRMACLEALARARRIPTRVRALWIKGMFWRRRFPYIYAFFPQRILLLWPEFEVEAKWLSFEELHHPLSELAATNPRPFMNDAETLFEAVETQAIDLFGKTRSPGCDCGPADLSAWVVGEDSCFATRDEALVHCGSLEHSIRGWLFQRVFGDRPSSSTRPFR